MPTSALLQ